MWKVCQFIYEGKLRFSYIISSSSGVCISKDSFCDGIPDCPGGEDELLCHGIYYYNADKKETGFGEIIKQTFGIWHTKCYHKAKPPTDGEMVSLCRELGYDPPKPPKFRIVNEMNERAKGVDLNRPNATNVVVQNFYTPVKLNRGFKMYMKPSQPVATLIHWSETDRKECHRMEIRCEHHVEKSERSTH